jgi:hypothetical protein
VADPHTSVLTDWRSNEDDLPDVGPGEEHDLFITPQKFVVLHRVLVRERGLILVRLGIGAVEDVPFERIGTSDTVQVYRAKDLGTLKRYLADAGAAVVTDNVIAVPPGMDVHLTLRNTGAVPAKPRAALFVQEESSPG